MENNEKATAEQPAENKTETAAAKKSKAAETKKASSVLEKVGKNAIREHGLAEVFVTADGQVFKLESDAKNHARNLKDREVLKVKK